MSSSFGKWYEDQQASQNGEGAAAGSSWFDTEQGLPLFSTEGMPGFSLESMRESMEASMPRKILGMGYQQRFQVRRGRGGVVHHLHDWIDDSLLQSADLTLRLPLCLFVLGLLRLSISLGPLLCPSLLCWFASNRVQAAKVRSLVYVWVVNVHG